MKSQVAGLVYGPIADYLPQVVRIFDEELISDQTAVADLCESVGRYRGKMLRPGLLLLSAKACGRVEREHLVLAAVVEMVHIATLVHDDVLDEADIRRNQPTVNRRRGNETAVLLGDYLISHAYHLCSSLSDAGAARAIAAATNTVCEGELMQVSQRANWALREDQYLEIIRRKTAALTAVACELGARFAAADDETVQRLANFGADLGMAFQIVDDLLDITATEREMGKSLGRDADLGKLTLPMIHYLGRLDESERPAFTGRLARGKFDLSALNGDRRRFDESLEHTALMAQSYVRSAVSYLADLPAGEARDSLIAAAEFVLSRRQ